MNSASRTGEPPRKGKTDPSPAFLTGSGNVFADLGHPEPELALAKAKLCSRLADLVESQKLTEVVIAVRPAADATPGATRVERPGSA